ncbi:MAG: IS110 family transposase [bacterium]|nr:IS110 family transposase [bacterium]
MFYVGIDVAKDKNDCVIMSSDGKIVVPNFSFSNNATEFEELNQKISSCSLDPSCIKIGLEATGHYSNHVVEYLANHQFQTFVVNPLHTCLYRKSLSFRKTKTDKVDAMLITDLLRTETLLPYEPSSEEIQQLKSLCRYRFTLVQDRSRLKVSTTRLINILFPELEHFVSDLNGKSAHALMLEFPNAKEVASCHLTHLTTLLSKASKGHHKKEDAILIRNAAITSVGSENPMQSLELQQTIQRIQLMDTQIKELERRIKLIMKRVPCQIMTIPGISYEFAAIILSEIGSFSNFSSPAKILAFAGLEPSIYQSGQYTSTYAKMVKRGSKYLRFALVKAAESVCNWDPTFAEYLAQKLDQGKPYYVAISHVAKKLTRVIYCLETKQIAYK